MKESSVLANKRDDISEFEFVKPAPRAFRGKAHFQDETGVVFRLSVQAVLTA